MSASFVYELPIPWALRVARYGRRLIFQNRNVIRLHEEYLPAKGYAIEPRPWPMEFEGREYATEAGARRADDPDWRPCFFDTWEDAEAWMAEGVFDA